MMLTIVLSNGELKVKRYKMPYEEGAEWIIDPMQFMLEQDWQQLKCKGAKCGCFMEKIENKKKKKKKKRDELRK